ncbi:DUF3311 domain-containing protein [Beijerinckia mobilis]|uniref:DUF3311 domain-containing protein n=1 Tax=Beijerinckia mobilis TaxID=231434 RepID=UPI000557BAF6|nr:DUF3311 domain-containing protein [Beijerinckia mobilis]
MKFLIFILGPSLLAIAVPLYNRIEPRLAGFPVFYWYLLLLIPFGSLCLYLYDRGRSDDRRPE